MIVRCKIVEGDRGAVSRENRGRNRAGSGRIGAGSGIYSRAGSGSRNKEDDNFFITGYYLVKNTYLAKS